MIHIKFKNKQFGESFESELGFVTGTAFTKDGQKLSGKPLMDHLATFEEAADLASFLPGFNGFYAFVIKKGNHLFAAVDRIRSIPIFYGTKGQDLFVSDDARWVREQVCDDDMDPLAKEELLLTGYVTGQDTLFPGVKQVQAGELVSFQQNSHGEISIEQHRYYRYLHEDYFYESEEELHQKLDDVLVNIFSRLISYADGRTIVVPLSGGYDSRLIVLMLKRLGYENVIAFSYGRPGNEEAVISRFVAEKLGIRWEFVPYSNELWHEWCRSSEMKRYFEFADGLASLPFVQDWPAVWALKQEQRIPDDAIFVPGIAADLNTGGFIEKYPEIYSKKAIKENLVEVILHYSYSLLPFKSVPKKLQVAIRERINMLIGGYPYGEPWGESFECWVSTEKVAKFVLNSVRVYEFFGYEWWTPFWDKEFADFWYNVPHQLRYGQKLYKTLIATITKNLFLFGDIDPVFRDGAISSETASMLNLKFSNYTRFRKWLISTAKRILPEEIKKWLRKERNICCFKNHPMGWYGIHDDGYVREQIRNGATMINSILAIDYMDMFHKKDFRE